MRPHLTCACGRHGRQFPEEEAAIRQYVKLVASVSHDSEVHLIGKVRTAGHVHSIHALRCRRLQLLVGSGVCVYVCGCVGVAACACACVDAAVTDVAPHHRQVCD